MKFKVILELDNKWVKNFDSHDELVDYIKARLNSSLGFKGQVKGLREVKR